MKIAALIARLLLGLLFTVFGLNAFLQFIPMPKEAMPPAAEHFMAAMIPTGYMHAVAVFEVIGGLLLLIGRFVPLGLTLLGPVIVNIGLYHAFIDHKPNPIAVLVIVLEAFLIFYHRAAFAGVFQAQSPAPDNGAVFPR